MATSAEAKDDDESPRRKPCWLPLQENEPESLVEELWLSKPKTKAASNETYGPSPASLLASSWYRELPIPKDWGPASKLLGGFWAAGPHGEALRDLTLVVGDDDVVYRSGTLNLLVRAAQELSEDDGLARARIASGALKARGFVVSSTVMPLRSEQQTWRPYLALSWPPHVVQDCREEGTLPQNGVDVEVVLPRAPNGGLGLGPTVNSEMVQDQRAIAPQVLGQVGEKDLRVRAHLAYGDLVRGVGAFALMPGRLPRGWEQAAAILANISSDCMRSDDLTLSIAFQISGIGILGISASKESEVFEAPAFAGGLPGARLARYGAEDIEESSRRTEQRYIACINEIELWWAKKKRQVGSRSLACNALRTPWHVTQQPPKIWKDPLPKE